MPRPFFSAQTAFYSLNFSLNHCQLLPLPLADSPYAAYGGLCKFVIAASVSLIGAFESPFERPGEAPEPHFWRGFPHAPENLAFFPPFLLFFLAFCDSLACSPICPDFFRRKRSDTETRGLIRSYQSE